MLYDKKEEMGMSNQLEHDGEERIHPDIFCLRIKTACSLLHYKSLLIACKT